MDRTIVYPGSIPLDTDVLSTNRNVMIALGALAAATLGNGPVVDGLSVQPGTGLSVTVSPGSVINYGPVDQGAYGSLAADVSDGLVKMGINIAAVTLPLSAPAGAGAVVTFLIQATFQELDVNPVVLPYYNAANPSQPFAGAANNGLAQPTLRSQRVALQAKAGAPGAAGANPIPTPDPGWIGLATVTVANGQTAVASANIAAYLQPKVLGFKLPDLRPGTSQRIVYGSAGAASFTVPQGVARLFVTVTGGGGAGGLHATLPSGGGGEGGGVTSWVYGLAPGAVVPIQVGVGGTPPATPGNGGWGGSSSFGPFLTGTGGQGGYGGTINAVMAGGSGGYGVGGELQTGGSCGTDAIPLAARGGDGGGAGSGRGTSGFVQGTSGTAPGAGGGGGGASAPSGAGAGAPGGYGAPGIVIVEF
jgi:hypothetical protein